MKEKLRNSSIKTKLVISFLLVSIVPSLFLAMFYISSAKDMVEDHYSQLSQKNIDNYEHDILVHKGGPKKEIYFTNQYILHNINNIFGEYFKSNPQETSYTYADDSISYIATVKRNRATMFIDVQKIEGAFYNTYADTIFLKIALFIIILSISFAFGITSYIVTGIDKLTEHIDAVNQNNFNHNININSKDEIGTLAKAFKNMTKRIDILINKTLKLEIAEKEAQFRAMQSQISPHFLYNALDNVNCSMIVKGDYENSEILCCISEILRYSISDYKRLVTIQKEQECLTNYLKIQKNRFEDMFNYEINIDTEALEYAIPKLTLQPILENAFKHAIEKTSVPQNLWVKGSVKENYIIFEITDDGVGIEPKKLNEIKKMLHFPANDNVDGKGIGLRNVNERIKLVYGEKFGLNIDSELNKGTTVYVYIGKIKVQT